MDIEAQKNPVPQLDLDNGKPSIIWKYCQNPPSRECLWLCYSEHGKVRAKDVPISDDIGATFDLRQLLRRCGWSKQISMYSVVEIREVEVSNCTSP